MKSKEVQGNGQSTLLAVFDEDLKRLQQRVGKDRSEHTWRGLLQGRNYVADFLKVHEQAEDICLALLMPQFINDFCVWLSVDRCLRGGTVWLACQQLKGVVTRAHQRGVLSWNPFAGFHIAKNIRPREFLTEEELQRLMVHRFKKPALSYARDVFLFSAFTGLSFIDMKELRRSDVVKLNGAYWVVSRRHKTKVPYQVKLLDVPLTIIDRYKSDDDLIFSPMEYRTMAKRIHKVIEKVGINKRISLHCARHTFAVMAINNGMPIESLSRILGHTNITTTQIYAKITLQKLDDDMTRLAETLKF